MQKEEPVVSPAGVPEKTAPFSMDRLTKRGVGVVGNQGNGSGSGNNARTSPASSLSLPGRVASTSQAAPSSPQVSSNRGSQQRIPSRQQNLARNQSGSSYGGRNGGSSKGGQQPQGLGGFSELGINGVEQGTRKHNYNHLINLSYGHRGDHGHGSGGRGARDYPRHHHVTHYQPQPKYNKEQFLQANCQFVVKDDGDYAVHHVDPDVLVEWNNIEIIKIYSHEELKCPICLHQPVAAKMTRCGHVYCWPCILHYLALSDAKWRKCPICYESVYGSELKSVVTQMTTSVKVGQDITMRLMVCERASVWPFPVTEWKDRKGVFYNIQEQDVSLGFSKFLTIRSDQIAQEILTREEHELLFAMETDGDNPESCFIEDALKQVSQRLTGAPPTIPTPTSSSPASPTPSTPIESKKAKKVYSSAFLEEERENEEKTEIPSGNAPISPVFSGKGSLEVDAMSVVSEISGESGKRAEGPGGSGSRRGPGQASFFYQSADGQHVYLHPLNVKMLVAQYGELSGSPMDIAARVVEVETWSVTESVRKRYRYLAHLPLTCVISLVELELKEPYISAEILHGFGEEIQQRERQRQIKSMHEERGQRDAENAFRKDIRGRISFSLQSEFFPNVTGETFSSHPGLDLTSEEAFPAVGTEPSTLPVSAVPVASPSFAQMLRQGKFQPQNKTSLVQWPATASSSRGPATTAPGDRHSDDEDHHPAPDFHNTFSTGLDAAFHRIQLMDQQSTAATASSSTNQPAGKTSKKKRPKGTLLFSTGSVPRI